ncbi:MAG: ribose transport system permease protein [Pseudonocardiales bacterium]|jgi:D-xylose transport system permease protein|nr:ribose transport system permease protein [Pseudonocardiales bacterium]
MSTATSKLEPTPAADGPSVLARVRPALSGLRPQRAGVVYALVLLVTVLVIATAAKHQPAYLSSVNVSNILSQSAPDAILAVFMTVVLISGNFDLSVASVAALAAALALKTIDSIGTAPAIVLALAVGVAVGAINAVLVQKIGVNAFIVTLGSMTAVRGIVLIALGGQSVTAQSRSLVALDSTAYRIPPVVAVLCGVLLLVLAGLRLRSLREQNTPPLDGFFLVLVGIAVLLVVIAVTAPALLTQPLPVWLMIWVTAGVAAVLRYLVPGRNLYAVGSNAEAARLSGINVDRYKMMPFVLTGLASAGVGLLYAGRFNSVDPNGLTGTELTVIAAAILGGTSLFGGAGHVAKSVLGTVVLFTLSNGFNVLNLGSNYQYVVQGAVLVAASAVYTIAAKSPARRQHSDRSDVGAATPAEAGTADSAETLHPAVSGS